MPPRPLVADVAGDGPPAVLLHGQPGSAAVWDRVVPLLDGTTTIVPDRPGYGRTGGPPADYAGNAAAVAGLLDRLGRGPAAVAAHSWAGPVALLLALERPDLVAGLALVASVAPGAPVSRLDRVLGRPPLGEAAAAATIGVTGRVLRVGPVRRAARRLLPVAAWETVDHHAPDPGAWRSFAAEQRTYVERTADLAGRLAEVAVPTVVVAGDADHVVGPGEAVVLAGRIPGAVLHPVPGAGHLLPWEHPAEVAAAVLEVLARAGLR